MNLHNQKFTLKLIVKFYLGEISTSKIVQFEILTNFENFKNSILGIFDFGNCKNFNFYHIKKYKIQYFGDF